VRRFQTAMMWGQIVMKDLLGGPPWSSRSSPRMRTSVVGVVMRIVVELSYEPDT